MKKIQLSQTEMLQAVVDHLVTTNPGYELEEAHFVKRPTGKFGADVTLTKIEPTEGT